MATSQQIQEAEITGVLETLFTTQYGLEKEDQETILRIIAYGRSMKGLTDEEITKLQEANIIDKKDDKLMIEDSYYFRGIILPAFWLKCLMALRGMIQFEGTFVSDKNEISKTK